MTARLLGLLLMAALVGAACNSQPAPEKPKPVRKSRFGPKPAAPKPAVAAVPDPPNIPASDHYGLPFAWEKADDEPLGQTRIFLSEVLRDNDKYLQRGKAFFHELQMPQRPRATVITCADSRVQSEAWDATPENDDFTIRNIGNQVLTALGSVQYGVERLNTPVLLILGHTGCGAVKAVLEQDHDLPKAIQKELEGIKLNRDAPNKKLDSVWADAVVENVHHQVRAALDKFGPRIVTGKLTVIGGVYDMKDDLGKGLGRISVVDVNGNAEPNRLRAFVAAVQESRAKAAPAAAPSEAAEPEVEVHRTARVQSASPPIPLGDDSQAAFIDVPGLITKETPQSGH
jgi:carbonic anhydrase